MFSLGAACSLYGAWTDLQSLQSRLSMTTRTSVRGLAAVTTHRTPLRTDGHITVRTQSLVGDQYNTFPCVRHSPLQDWLRAVLHLASTAHIDSDGPDNGARSSFRTATDGVWSASASGSYR